MVGAVLGGHVGVGVYSWVVRAAMTCRPGARHVIVRCAAGG